MFLGRHFVEAALATGHSVTLFHRGKTNPDLFPEIEHIHGDRRVEQDREKLRRRRWDAVLDPSGYFPADVDSLGSLLRDSVDHYTFVSSISVYEESGRVGPDERSQVMQTTDDMPLDRITPESYGAFKAACERIAEERMPGRTLNVRAGLIVGPHDPTDRFTYWPWRVASGGRVAAPGNPDDPVQFIDARDLAGWMLRMIEREKTGTYNVTGPERPLSMGEFLDACRDATGSKAEFVWLSEEMLAERQVAPFTEMPLWVPSEASGMNRADISRALADGLTTRPVADTIRDTLDWFRTSGRNDGDLRAGITRERERELIEAAAMHG